VNWASGTAVALCVLAGVAGSVQVSVMGRFGERVSVLGALAFSTIVTAAIATAALLVARRGLGALADGARQPPWLWLGGVMGVFIVLTITLAGPRIGTAATVGLLIAGQLTMAAAIDRFGLFGSERIELGAPRLVGIALLAVGAALSLRK